MGTGGGSGGGSGSGRGSSSSPQSLTPKDDAPKPTGLFSDIPPTRADPTGNLGDEQIEPIDPAKDPGTESDGAGADKATPKTPESDNQGSGGLAGSTEEEAAAKRTASGAGAEFERDSTSSAAEADPNDDTASGGGPEAAAADSVEADTSARSAMHADADRAPQTSPEDIEIPVFDVEQLDLDGVLLDEAQTFHQGRAHPISGIWEQIAGPNSSDFAPGGYERSVIALNPANKTVSIYRLFRGDIAMVVGGQLALDCEATPASRSTGALSVRSIPSLHSKFRTTALPLGGAPAVVMEPPAGSGPWAFEWRRERMELVIGDKRYVAITRAAFDGIRTGGGDVATAADRSERIPDRKPGARGIAMKETSFFGIRGGGKRICFVVDMSGSMAGMKFDRLKQELTQTIQGFDPGQFFSVAFFHGQAEVLDQSWMQAGRDGARATRLIAQQGMGGGTDPTGAFQFAFQSLSPMPDCIYFMTDGQIPPHIPDLLRSLNVGANRTIIHTINFGEPASESIMKLIAKEHAGTYTFVQP